MALAWCLARSGLEEDLAMGERGQAPGSSGEKPGHDPEVLDEAREAAEGVCHSL
jgi:hypothetical protein